MAKLITNSVLLVVVTLIASASLSHSQSVQITATGLTCSLISPLPLFYQPLSGANATLLCNNGLTAVANANATTDASGNLNITVATVPSGVSFFPITCRVLITVPDNCTITFFFRRIQTLRSLAISSVPFQSFFFQAGPFVGVLT